MMACSSAGLCITVKPTSATNLFYSAVGFCVVGAAAGAVTPKPNQSSVNLEMEKWFLQTTITALAMVAFCSQPSS